ncbi:hypothetical protein LH427_14280 [Laribacter hongkongensis]|uniref:hypothetical protein n=1 Tax=Laribacter hongkongensis TaxID=168471 RepID=UPI001EFE0DE6|nr:hypothetical protein [Laribacter hongkongensis]MCG8993363.1 hypothetical protein [Laribacter hongkongensis]MCG8999204.1 hypothetical protein [Laribacter hongkongensis]MCG9002370.1 hypothetical protein [Laribacter hongkongensis]MCG9005498.1 hypothetical protein [Laribacter hongkongensis]MCG9007983.1 hypothetical protein [Laribacter hongkongensis]
MSPKDSSSQAEKIEIKALGDKDHDSRSSEVWFYGAFRISDGSKIPWDEFQLDSSWERRGDIYVSYKNQPSSATLICNEPIRLDFGSHPYSGIVNVNWRNGGDAINLYSKNGSVKNIIIDQRPTYRDSQLYPLIIGCFVLWGISLAAGFVFLRWTWVYPWMFYLSLLFSIYLTLAAYFPGVYTNDSIAMFHLALTDKYSNWHSPVMAWFWSVLIKGTGRIESLMVVHLILLGMGAAYWFGVFNRLRVGFFGLFLPVLILSPIVINFSGVVWRDVGFAFSMFFCCGIVSLALADKHITLGRIVAVLSLLVYAFGVRSNGVFAIFPVAFFLSWVIFLRGAKDFSNAAIIKVGAVAASFILVAIVLSVQLFSAQYLKSENRYPFQYIEIYDLAGISTISGKDYFPGYIKDASGYDIKKVSEVYLTSVEEAGSANNLLLGSKALIKLNHDIDLQEQLRVSWIGGIFREPLAYLKHRWLVFDFLMSQGFYPFEKPQKDHDREALFKGLSKYLGFPDNHESFDIASSTAFPGGVEAKNFVEDALAWSSGSVLYIGWLWLAVLLTNFVFGLLIARCTCSGLMVLMLSASGLLYMLPYFFVAPAADFRYLYWCSLTGGVSSILIVSLVVNFVFKRALNFLRSPPICATIRNVG